jgi:hypothetical protein
MNTHAGENMSGMLLKLVLMALAFTAAALLLRDGFAIASHIPLDPDEGWNAYLARAAVSGGPLYPQAADPWALMTNNYPPLSFYLIGALGTITGDAIVAGRLVSLVAFFALTGGVVVVLRELGADVLVSLFGALFLAVGLLAASDYVAMNDPQLLGHALQLAGLSLLLQARRETIAAALLMAAGLFIKHNLLALPLAASLWLLLRDRREGLRFMGAGLVFCLAGLAACRMVLGVNLIAALASPRLWQIANFTAGTKQFLEWAGLALIAPVLLLGRRRHAPAVQFVTLYAALGLGLGALFAFGDGVDANCFFDAAIALALCSGLALTYTPRRWRGPLGSCIAIPLALYLAHNSADANFHFSEAFAREAPLDIDFLRAHPGPALCEDLTLCYWAGKDTPVDVFNISEAIKTGARSDADLARLLAAQYFGSIALSSVTPFALGPHLRQIMMAHYRVMHADDNGVFLERR